MATVTITVAGSSEPFLNGAEVFTFGGTDLSNMLDWVITAQSSRIQTLFNSSGSSSYVSSGIAPTHGMARTAWARSWMDGSVMATNRHIQDTNVATAILGSTTITIVST